MRLKIIFAIITTAVLLFSCQQQSNEKGQQIENSKKSAQVVKVLKLEKQKVQQTIRYAATLMPFKEVHLAPSTPGKIKKITVDIGDKVRQGNLLVEMDMTQLQQSEIQLKTLSEDLKRFEILKQNNSIAPQKYDQLKAQYDVAKSNVEFLKTNTRLSAPFNGIVSGKYYEPGEIYSGAPNPLTGKAAILTLVQCDKLKVMMAVSEKYYPFVKNKMKAEITSELYPNKVFEAQVFNVYPTIDAASRTFNVELVLDNLKQNLQPGMFVKAGLFIGEIETNLVPDNAVLKVQGSDDRYLFINNNGTAKRIPVIIGERYDNKIEVLSDELKTGDEIIVTGQAKLYDGDPLQIVQ